MRISTQEIDGILAERYRGFFSALVGISVAGIAFSALCYVTNPINVSPDDVAIAVVLALLFGWAGRAILTRKISKQATVLADILGSDPGSIRPKFNAAEKTVTLEKTGDVDFGMGSFKGAVIAEVELSFDEAKRIGFAISADRGLPLLLGGGSAMPTSRETSTADIPVAHEVSH